MIQFSDLEFAFYDGYIYLGSGLTWLPLEVKPERFIGKIWPDPTIGGSKKNEYDKYPGY